MVQTHLTVALECKTFAHRKSPWPWKNKSWEEEEVDGPGQTGTNEEDLPGHFSVDGIKSHKQALEGHGQVALHVPCTSPPWLSRRRDLTRNRGFIVFEWDWVMSRWFEVAGDSGTEKCLHPKLLTPDVSELVGCQVAGFLRWTVAFPRFDRCTICRESFLG